MSQEIEDFVRSLYDRFNRGERLPPADAWHADGVYVNSSDDPDPGIHRGLEAITRQFQAWVEAYPDLRVDPLEILVNGDRVLVWAHWSGHGAGSGVPIEMEMAQVSTVEDGKIRRVEEYMDREEALKAVGLAGQAMSQANVEIAKRAIDAFNRRDLDALAELVTPDNEVVPAMAGVVESGSYRGREGFETWFREIHDTWEEFRIVTEEIRDLGDRVLYLGRMEGHGRGSGVPVQAPLGVIFEFREGKIARSCGYLDHGEAWRAAGLAEWPMSDENVEIVRRAIYAFTKRDLDAALRDLDADAVVDWSRSRGLEAGVYRGHTAIRDFWKTFLDVFAKIEVSDVEFIASGEYVVAPNRMRARGRDGIEVDARYVAVVRLRGGRIVEWRLFPDKEQALKAAGLRG